MARSRAGGGKVSVLSKFSAPGKRNCPARVASLATSASSERLASAAAAAASASRQRAGAFDERRLGLRNPRQPLRGRSPRRAGLARENFRVANGVAQRLARRRQGAAFALRAAGERLRLGGDLSRPRTHRDGAGG